ncbi:MAG TPA: hypothetical protein VHV55_15800 [Pirellulales bacterium]|jgi:hypothetical protein|nr:hypothetical protein [Pirellulales bacterium]
MSSPFSIFRKHQRAMMAVLGIMCMFAFTFTGFMGGLDSGGGSNSQNPVAVQTSFGDYRETDLQLMRQQRNLVKSFLQQVILLTIDPQMRPFLEPRVAQMIDQQMIGPSTDRALVESRVLAREAKHEGIVVSDESITDFLREQTGDRVRGDQFQEILSGISRARGVVNKAMLYEALRTELLAEKMKEVFRYSLQSTPSQRWDYFQRLKRRVRVELAPVAAADLVSKISNPSDAVARKFFDEYKDREPQPGSPEPGFKIPHRAAFRYFELHYDEFYHPEEVSAAEIAKHYEKNKDTQYLYNELQGSGDEDEEEPAEPATPEKKPPLNSPKDHKSDTKAHKTNSDGTHPDDKQTDAPKAAEAGASAPGAAKTPATPDKPKPPKTDKPDQVKPADNKPDDGDDEPKTSGSNCGSDPKTDDDENDPADKSSGEKGPAAKQPAAEEKQPPAPSVPTEKPSTPPAAQDKPASGSATGGSTTGGSAPSDVKTTPPGSESKAPAAKPHTELAKKSTAPQLSDRFVLPRDITKGPNPKYEPLWQAEPKIRKELAGSKAVQQMQKVVLDLKAKLRPYVDAYIAWENHKRQEPNAQTPPPTPPDFETLAKGMRGVTVGRIPLSPDFEIAQAPGIGGSQVGGQPFVAFAATGLKLFHAVESQDMDGNRYLFWKTDDQEARIPEFNEERNEIVRVWKLREARRPMLERAEELAKKARESKKSLKDALAGEPGVQVSETPAFSWMTGGSAGQFSERSEPRQSDVPGTVDIGDEFMQKVFDLQVGDVGVAENHPQSIAYVVRMTTSEPPSAVLRDMFVVERFESYQSVAMDVNRSLYQQWMREQMDAFKVHWVRPPYEETREE